MLNQVQTVWASSGAGISLVSLARVFTRARRANPISAAYSVENRPESF
ncbi:hypothetical protein [Spirosoma pollinicola]|nr:hypothetical protein [Spirosoma pollinicola]